MSGDMDETEGLPGSEVHEEPEVPAAPRRVIGTPPPSPGLLGSGDGGAGAAGRGAVGGGARGRRGAGRGAAAR